MFKSVSKIKTTGSALFFNAVLMYFVDLSECIVVTIFYFVCVVLTFPRVAEKVWTDALVLLLIHLPVMRHTQPARVRLIEEAHINARPFP